MSALTASLCFVSSLHVHIPHATEFELLLVCFLLAVLEDMISRAILACVFSDH